MSSQATGDPGNARWGPHNTVTVVDPSPVNWLSITWNTMEEANRVDHEGMGQPSLAAGWRWVDDETLELPLRRGAVFQDGEAYDAKIQVRGAGIVLYTRLSSHTGTGHGGSAAQAVAGDGGQ